VAPANPVTATVLLTLALTVLESGAVPLAVAVLVSDVVDQLFGTVNVKLTLPGEFAASEPSVQITVPALFEHALPPLQLT
jgi:hypothetical protein